MDAGRIIVTSGSLQGFVLLVEHLGAQARAAGRTPVAIVENPTYDRPLILLERAGWDVRQVPIDADGVEPLALEEALEAGTADLVYLIPSFQNPAGSTLTDERRTAVLKIVTAHGVPLLEDDPYGALHFDNPPAPTLFESGTGAEVLYSSSFSKTVSPGLRVGYLIVPEERTADIERRANDTYISPSLLAEATVLDYLQGPTFEDDITRVRAMLAARCGQLCDALREYLPDAEFDRPGGGYFLWARLGSGLDAAQLAAASAGMGATFVPGSAFGPGNGDALRLAFSSPPAEQIEEGIRRIATALASITARA